MFDLYVLPLGYHDQKNDSLVQGYYIGTAQKRTARNREFDIVLFKFSATHDLLSADNAEVERFLQKAATLFFRTNGPVTTAIRQCSGFFNELLIKHNQGKTVSQIITGTLQLAVFHAEEAYFAHAGSAATYVINNEQQDLFINQAAGSQGVGVSKAIKFSFFYKALKNGDRIIMTGHPPQGWTKVSLSAGSRNSISHMRKILIDKAESDFEAIVIQVRNGNGAIHQLRLDGTQQEQTGAIDEEIIDPLIDSAPTELNAEEEFPIVRNLENELGLNAPNSPKINEDSALILPVDPVEKDEPYKSRAEFSSSQQKVPISSPESVTYSVTYDEAESEKASIDVPKRSHREILQAEQKWEPEAAVEEKIGRQPSIAFSRRAAKWLITIKNFLVKVTSKSESLNTSISENTAKLISRTNPASSTNSSTLSLTSMFFIAILVPVLVVATATTVYFRSGRGEQHQKFALQANELITQANDEVDDVKRLVILQDALLYLDEAEKYGKTEASQELRLIVQKHLDILQGVTRLQLQPTVQVGIDRRINFSRMVVSFNEDIYALDQVTGRVLRMVATRPDYQVDTTFVCGPGKYGQTVVHELVDIDLISFSNARNATLIGIDRAGSVILCSPGGEPFAITLKTPELGWGHIQAIGFNGYSLYILDIDERTRDLYRLPSDGLSFEGNPESIFSGNTPADLSESADIALYDSQLYVLSNNGNLMECSLNNVQILCTPNIGYGIIQSGQERKTTQTITGTKFVQIQTTQPPDPSIYFMDQLNGSVYHFSLAMNMQKQIRPDFVSLQSAPQGDLTAFAVSPYGVIHFAFGHALYFGYIP